VFLITAEDKDDVGWGRATCGGRWNDMVAEGGRFGGRAHPLHPGTLSVPVSWSMRTDLVWCGSTFFRKPRGRGFIPPPNRCRPLATDHHSRPPEGGAAVPRPVAVDDVVEPPPREGPQLVVGVEPFQRVWAVLILDK